MSQLLQYYKSFSNRAPVAKKTPTFEDLSIDDNLSEVQRLVKYAKSSIALQRLVHVKMLADVAKSSLFSELMELMSLVESFANDFEPAVRHHLVWQLPLLAEVLLQHGKKGYDLILSMILPTISAFFEETKQEIRQAASSSLVKIAKLIKPEDLGQYVLTIVLHLAHEDDKEEMRMVATELLNELAECFGQDLCRQFVVPEMVSLAEDPVFRVRKSAALNFHYVCKVGGDHELFERLMPAFVRLSKDDMYRVRKACAESLYEISKYVNEDIRIGVLVEIFLRLTQDPSKVVRQAVLQQSGMFITTLPSRIISDLLLSHYCSMVSDPVGDATIDNDLKYHCAFTFPGVLLTIGGSRWKEIKEVYHSLILCRAPKIRLTLAASLHEVAKILADEAKVEEELVPVFEDMIQDTEEIQMGVIKNLAVFLSLLAEPCRISYLPILHDIVHSTNPFNWRLRQALAVQLPALIDLPPKTEIYSTLFPLMMTLLQDPVANVRLGTYPGVSKMINVLAQQAFKRDTNSNRHEDGNLNRSWQDFESVIKTINSLIRGETFHLRQLWLQLAHRLLQDLTRELFESYFLDGILVLTSDSVAVVRFGVATLLAGWPQENPPNLMTTLSDIENSNVNSSNHVSTHGNLNSSNPSCTSPTMFLMDKDEFKDENQLNSNHSEELNNTNSNSSLNPISSDCNMNTNTNTNSGDTTNSHSSSSSSSSSSNNSDSSSHSSSSNTESPWTWLLKRSDIQQCIQRLSQDDMDVYQALLPLKPFFPEVTFRALSCRGRKSAPGGIHPVSPVPSSDCLSSSPTSSEEFFNFGSPLKEEDLDGFSLGISSSSSSSSHAPTINIPPSIIHEHTTCSTMASSVSTGATAASITGVASAAQVVELAAEAARKPALSVDLRTLAFIERNHGSRLHEKIYEEGGMDEDEDVRDSVDGVALASIPEGSSSFGSHLSHSHSHHLSSNHSSHSNHGEMSTTGASSSTTMGTLSSTTATSTTTTTTTTSTTTTNSNSFNAASMSVNSPHHNHHVHHSSSFEEDPREVVELDSPDLQDVEIPESVEDIEALLDTMDMGIQPMK